MRMLDFRRVGLERRFHRFYRLACKDPICVYCGLPATTRDHFVPITAVAALSDVGLGYIRGKVLLPSCGECNSLAGNKLFPSVGSKRRFIHAKLRKRYAKVLAIPHWTEEELQTLGYSLRHLVMQGLTKKECLERRLEWRNDSNREAVRLAAIRSSLVVYGKRSAALLTDNRGTGESVKLPS